LHPASLATALCVNPFCRRASAIMRYISFWKFIAVYYALSDRKIQVFTINNLSTFVDKYQLIDNIYNETCRPKQKNMRDFIEFQRFSM
jgi:hypothetical protein